MSFSHVSAKIPPPKGSTRNRYIYSLPKMSRTQFSDFCDHIVDKGWRIRQAGFGDPQVYQVYFRPGSSSLFKKKTSLIPVWADVLKRKLPLGTKQLITLMKSREAFKVEFRDLKDEERRLTIDRGGTIIAQLVQKEEIEDYISYFQKNLQKEKYRVLHSLTPSKVKKNFSCSYFSIKRKAKDLNIVLYPRIERKGAIYRYLHRSMTSLLTSDENIVLAALLTNIKDDFKSGTICAQSITMDEKFNLIPLKTEKKYKMGRITVPTEEIIDKLDQLRLFSTFLQGASFVTCPNLTLTLHSNSILENKIDLRFLTEDVFPKLEKWCYDSRFFLNLKEDWKKLYPGDLPKSDLS